MNISGASLALVEAPFLFLGMDIAEYILDRRKTATGSGFIFCSGTAAVWTLNKNFQNVVP
jgi:hypothetical protein